MTLQPRSRMLLLAALCGTAAAYACASDKGNQKD